MLLGYPFVFVKLQQQKVMSIMCRQCISPTPAGSCFVCTCRRSHNASLKASMYPLLYREIWCVVNGMT